MGTIILEMAAEVAERGSSNIVYFSIDDEVRQLVWSEAQLSSCSR